MTKQELIKYSANEVKSNKALFAAFVSLYVSSGGRQSDCFSCKFSSTFARWKNEGNQNENLITRNMKPVKNTFELTPKAKKQTIYMPMMGALLTEYTSDELALEYLNQNKGKNYEQRSKLFSKLPEAPQENVKPEGEAAKGASEINVNPETLKTDDANSGEEQAQDMTTAKAVSGDASLKLSELRAKYPEVKARSKEEFLEKL